MDLVRLVDALHEFTKRFAPYIITRHQDNYIVAVDGQVCTTKFIDTKSVWRVDTAAKASVWWLQHPSKPFEALSTATYV